MMQARCWLRNRWVWGLVALLLAAAAWAWHAARLVPWLQAYSAAQAPLPKAAATAATPRYVGAQACMGCHRDPGQAWRGSHHQLAMQAASPATVLAPFRGERLTVAGVSTEFSQRGGKYFVRTQGPDGRMGTFEVTHALGLAPLQQYLVPMPNQGMQALTMAWDTRPQADGGQRWFDLQAGQPLRPGDDRHWTGRQNNWNFMCAECHVTQFKKDFDPLTRRYNSSWAQMGVSCEACHGPGSRHVDWSRQDVSARLADASKGLAQWFNERKGVQWTIDPATGNVRRSSAPAPMAQRAEVELCARCHAHRSQISDDYVHGKPLLDTHVPSLLEPGLFWRDGQMKAEVYNYASFQQSKMFQQGVTCSDCHNPHSGKLRLPGNATCLQCHAPAKYDAPLHHFHAAGSSGASCAACHMPVTTYMRIDPRHDHGIRVPRPDLSLHTGAPNACTKCHTDKPATWAAQWALTWYPRLPARPAPLAQALLASEPVDAQGLALLFRIMNDAGQPPIARATALARAAPAVPVAQLPLIGALTRDPDPLVRWSAVEALAGAQPQARAPWLLPALADPARGVRIAAARWLAGVPAQGWSLDDQARFASALDEYIAVQQFNADRPEADNNLATLYGDQGKWHMAESTLKLALAREPAFGPTALNLADVYRAQGREGDAQAVIHGLLKRQPTDAAAHHALGLSLLRQHRVTEALVALRQAARLLPANPRYAFVYALALDANGQTGQAIAELMLALKANPKDSETGRALAALCRRTNSRMCPLLE